MEDKTKSNIEELFRILIVALIASILISGLLFLEFRRDNIVENSKKECIENCSKMTCDELNEGYNTCIGYGSIKEERILCYELYTFDLDHINEVCGEEKAMLLIKSWLAEV